MCYPLLYNVPIHFTLDRDATWTNLQVHLTNSILFHWSDILIDLVGEFHSVHTLVYNSIDLRSQATLIGTV